MTGSKRFSFRSSTASVLGLLILVVSAGIIAGCGSSDSETGTDAEAPTVAVTTSILGDVVSQLVGGQAEVITMMPAGVDPHDFRPSAREVEDLLDADAVVSNGGGLEEGLVDILSQAGDEGVPVFDSLESVSKLATVDHEDEDHEDHEDEDHEDHEDEDHEDHEDEDHEDHDHGEFDPHFFTDPNRMTEVVSALAEFLKAELPGIDVEQLDADAGAYLDELVAVDAEITDLLSVIEQDRRVLVTNHDVLGYFADSYDFEVIGVVVPGGSTNDAVSAGQLSELLDVIEAEQVPAIFIDSSASSDLADTVTGDAEEIEAVELYTESLGEPGSEGDTYVSMLRANGQRIAAALG